MWDEITDGRPLNRGNIPSILSSSSPTLMNLIDRSPYGPILKLEGSAQRNLRLLSKRHIALISFRDFFKSRQEFFL